MSMKVTRVFLGVGFAGALAIMGCSTMGMGDKGVSYPLQVSGDVPAAKGTVRVKTEKAGNQEVEVKVEHMAPPDLARSGSNFYVVWLRPQGTDQPLNAGVLSVGDDRKG